MTTKMTRRTFLKGAAAAAAAVSLSGLLTGCGGDQLADNEVQIGPFIVKVYGLDVNLCPGHSGKSARGFLPFCPGAEGWFWAVFPAM